MERENKQIIILGAGLSGLCLAYLLQKQGRTPIILEARDRLGGRIHTLYKAEQAPIELGATWLGKQHVFLMNLLEELDLPIFPQRLGDAAIFEAISTSPPQLVSLPPNNDPSFRIQGGTSQLIERLVSEISTTQIPLGQVVEAIHYQDEHFSIKTNKANFQTELLISTLPPNLLVNSIEFHPQLPEDLQAIAKTTHTWMGESIKSALCFERAFWREPNLSGTIFSNVGPISEMYDHANVEDNRYALKGFLNGSLYGASKAERLQLILRQLRKYFGAAVDKYTSYEECVWRLEKFSFTDYEQYILPHQNNGHSNLQQAYFNQQFFLAGAETSKEFGGYMEGAIRSAYRVAEMLTKNTSS